ncbi:MAG: nitroreductase family protein [Clostridia bacterium]|nr:nitroreductase family protein [Clostridia bacterium]
MNSVIKNIYERKSVRKFLEKQISDDDIKSIVEAGIQAPSGHNAQSVYYTIVQNEDLIDHMNLKAKEEMRKSDEDWILKFGSNERYHVLHKAPTVIIVSASQEAYSPVEDSSAAIENMMLAATSLGIGAVWVGLIDHYFKLDESRKKLNLKDGYKPYFAVCLGYENPEKVFNKPKRNMDVYEWIR